MSDQCPVPNCVSNDELYCGTADQCADAKEEGDGMSLTVIIILCCIGGAALCFAIYKFVWKKWLKKVLKARRKEREAQSEAIVDHDPEAQFINN